MRELRRDEVGRRLQFTLEFLLFRGQQPVGGVEIIARAFNLADERAGSEAGLDPRQNFLLAGRFAQEIIGSAREPFRNLIGPIVRRHQDDVAGFEFGIRPDGFTDARPVQSGHHPIENNKVRTMFLVGCQSGVSIAGFDDMISQPF